jgi:hypothetical protein
LLISTRLSVYPNGPLSLVEAPQELAVSGEEFVFVKIFSVFFPI